MQICVGVGTTLAKENILSSKKRSRRSKPSLLPLKVTELLNEIQVLLQAQFFTAEETRKIRETAVRKLDAAIEEVWKERKNESFIDQSLVYHRIGLLAKIRDDILTNAELSDIHEGIEELKERAASEVQIPPADRKKPPRKQHGPYA